MKRSALIIFSVLFLDQALKIWIKTHLYLGEEIRIFDWFIIHYTENNGMAFGYEFGGISGKLFLSIFRIIASFFIGFYLYKLIKRKAHAGLIICFSLIFAGAIGNIIDSTFYGLIFSDDMNGLSQIFSSQGGYGLFLQGRVVDMLYFPIINTQMPEWVPVIGGDPFQFSKDRHHILMIIDEDEYNTKETLVEFRNREFRPLGLSSRISPLVIPVGADSPSLAKLISRADLVLVSVRRRMAAPETIAALKAHVAAGKPLVGIRTASHAFEVRDEAKKKELLAQGLADWTTFDAEVLGGHYANHHEVGPKTAVTIAEKGTNHPILLGIKAEELVGSGSLYLTRPLAKSAVPLLIGTVPGHEPEPIAWTNLAGSKQARVFYTSLGHPTDFENPQFRKLLLSGIFWTLEPDYSDVKVGN